MGIYLYIPQRQRNICIYGVSGKQGLSEKEEEGPEKGLLRGPYCRSMWMGEAASTEKQETGSEIIGSCCANKDFGFYFDKNGESEQRTNKP